jgi:hypothetical protein
MTDNRIADAPVPALCTTQTVSPQQEAFLDLSSHPWCADVWAIADLLAEGRRPAEPPAAALPGLGVSHMKALAQLLPQTTAFQLLREPSLAKGLGLRLKRSKLSK